MSDEMERKMKLIIKNKLVHLNQPPLLNVVCNVTYDPKKSFGFNESSKRQKSTFAIFESNENDYVFYSKNNEGSKIECADHLTDFDFPLTLFKNKQFLELAHISGIAESARNLVVQEDTSNPLMLMVLERDVRIFSDMRVNLSYHYIDGDTQYKSFVLKGEKTVGLVTNVGNKDHTEFSVHKLDILDFCETDLQSTSCRKTNKDKVKKVLDKIGIKDKEPHIEVFSEVRSVFLSIKHLDHPPQTYITKPREDHEIKIMVHGDAFFEKETDDLKIVWFKVPDTVGITALILDKDSETFTNYTALNFVQNSQSKNKCALFNLNNAQPLLVETFNEITKKNGIVHLDTYIGLLKDEPISGEPTQLHGMNVYGDHKLTIKHSKNRNIQFYEQYGDLYAILVDDTLGQIDEFNLKNIADHINDLSINHYAKADIAFDLLQKYELIK